jgi:hypothetical protein
MKFLGHLLINGGMAAWGIMVITGHWPAMPLVYAFTGIQVMNVGMSLSEYK